MVGEKRDRKDGARDLDLYSAIVAPSSTGSQPFLPTNSCLLIPPRRVQPSFSSTKAADPSPGIAKEQTRGRIYCSYCNVDESPMEFRELYTFGDSSLSLSIYIYVYIYTFVYTTSKRYCAFFSCEIRMKGYIARTREYSFKKGYFRLRFLDSLPGQD